MLVGHPLVDTSNWSAEVLLINTGSDVVVLPRSRVLVMWCGCLRLLLRGPCRLNRRLHRLGPFLHTSKKYRNRVSSLPGVGWSCRADIYSAQVQSYLSGSGDPVTSRTPVVCHEIVTNGARPIRCGPSCLSPLGLRSRIVYGPC